MHSLLAGVFFDVGVGERRKYSFELNSAVLQHRKKKGTHCKMAFLQLAHCLKKQYTSTITDDSQESSFFFPYKGPKVITQREIKGDFSVSGLHAWMICSDGNLFLVSLLIKENKDILQVLSGSCLWRDVLWVKVLGHYTRGG